MKNIIQRTIVLMAVLTFVTSAYSCKMPQNNVAKEILLFDFEFFTGARCRIDQTAVRPAARLNVLI
jgi:hypothetical protein